MNIPDLLNKITDAILHFQFGDLKNETKIIVTAVVAIGMLLILWAFGFSFLKQF